MRDILRSLSIYGLGGILNRSIQFLLLPVYTRVLLTSEFGQLEMVYMTANIMAILYGLMISSGFLRVFFDSRDENIRDSVFGSALAFTTLSSIIVGGGIALFSKPLGDAIFTFADGPTYLVLITLSTVLTVHGKLFYSLLMARERAKMFVAANAITLAVQLSLTVIFVVSLRWGVKGVLYAQIIAHGLELIVLIALLFRATMLRITVRATGEMLHFSVPLIPLQLAAFVVTLSDRFFLQGYKGLDEVGHYSLAYKFASVVPLLVIEPLKGCGPHIFKLIGDPDKCKRTLADFTRYYAAAALLVGLAIAMLSRDIIKVMANQSYHQSYEVVFALTMSYFFFGMFSLLSFGINIVKKNWTIGFSWLLAAGVSVAGNFLLVPRYGAAGAAFSSVTAQAIVVIVNAFIVERLYPTPIKYRNIFFLTLFACASYYVSSLIDARVLISVPLKLLILGAFVAGILLSGYFSPHELDRAKTLLKNIGGGRKPSDIAKEAEMMPQELDSQV